MPAGMMMMMTRIAMFIIMVMLAMSGSLLLGQWRQGAFGMLTRCQITCHKTDLKAV
jgi:hypothetical protein